MSFKGLEVQQVILIPKMCHEGYGSQERREGKERNAASRLKPSAKAIGVRDSRDYEANLKDN